MIEILRLVNILKLVCFLSYYETVKMDNKLI